MLAVMTITLVGSRDRQLEELLRASGMQPAVLEAAQLPTLASPGARQPDVIVIDVRDGTGIPPAVAAIRRQHPATGVVLVASTLDPAMLLEAMRAGVNELVSDPVTQGDLERAIARVIEQRPASVSGKVFGFIGAKGGVGTTTVAVNVAIALGAASEPERALLIDLHHACGDAAVFLGVEPRFSVVDALENTRRLDTTFFRGLVAHAGPGLDLLASSERAVAGQSDPSRVRAVVDFVATVYKYTVLDLPRSDGAVLDALDRLSAIVIVANQELAAVRSASRMAATLRTRYGAGKVSVVVSRSDRQAEIGHEDVARAIGFDVAHTFPSDYRRALQALNKGRPLALDNHNELSSSLKRFASNLAGVRSESAAPARAGLLGRLTRGRQS
jgi:pilus assembly protein CpaE